MTPGLLIGAWRGAYGAPFCGAQGGKDAAGSRLGCQSFVDGHDHQARAFGAGRHELDYLMGENVADLASTTRN
jgi:hypothetical protein